MTATLPRRPYDVPAASLVTDRVPRCGYPFPVGRCTDRGNVAGHLCARPAHHADGRDEPRCRCSCGVLARSRPDGWCPGCADRACTHCHDLTLVAVPA